MFVIKLNENPIVQLKSSMKYNLEPFGFIRRNSKSDWLLTG